MNGMSGDVVQAYREFAELELHGYSPSYERLCLGVVGDPELVAAISTLPVPKRQPNLLLAAARYLGAPLDGYAAFRGFALSRWDDFAQVMRTHATQTNEAGRCAALLPLLARLPQPLALLEVGASAGLCLYPDRLSYHYRPGGSIGEGPVSVECEVTGPMPMPQALPEVVWRAGLDLNPLDVRDEEDCRWLESLVWPEQQHRRARLRGMIEIARQEPPLLVRGDLTQDLPRLAAQAPRHATLVVFHTAVLAYVPAPGRQSFVDSVRGLAGHWISNEAAQVLPDVVALTSAQPFSAKAAFVLALDGAPVAYAGAHGQSLHWL